jgi:hypothetical protein
MWSCSSDISAFGAVVRMVNERVTVSSGQRKLSHRPSNTHRLPVLTGNGVGLLAALDHPPLVECVRRRHVLRGAIREEKAARILV